MNKLIIILLSILVLNACASSSEVYTSDGKPGHSISCSGNALDWGDCFEKAGEICGTKGYDVLEKSGDQGLTISREALINSQNHGIQV